MNVAHSPVALWLLAAGLSVVAATVSRAGDTEEFLPVGELPAVGELPDLLTMQDGTPVASVEDWHARRKPELRRLLMHYMYGQIPPPPPTTATVQSTHADCLGGKATMKQITIAFAESDCPTIDLLLIVPNRAAQPAADARSPAERQDFR